MSELISRISADSLFHFTSSIEILVSILEHTFYPRYCWENISTLEENPDRGNPSIAIPMVCFCDIPLSQVRDHIMMYGNYGIGLTKEWGIKKGMNPVAYTIPKSKPVEGLRKTVDYLTGLPFDDISLSRAQRGMTEFGLYTKSYKGRFFRDGKFLQNQIYFYNEREWRYVPPFEDLDAAGLSTTLTWKKHSSDSDIINKWNAKLANECNLSFNPDDIKYLIVKDDSEVLRLANAIRGISRVFTDDQRILLTTRIISMEQIAADF